MPTAYYNASFGNGLEGFINWANAYSSNMMTNLFLIMVWIVSTYVLSKSEWKMSNVVAFTSLLIFMLSLIARLFVQIHQALIFVSSIAFAIGLVWSIIDRGR